MSIDNPKSNLPLPVTDKVTYFERLNHYLALTLSIPERSARAMSAIIGGSTLLLSKTLIPNSIKNSNSYHFTLGMFQSFLIRNVAGMDNVVATGALGDRFVHPKLLGTSLEAAGLLTMHLSPVWVFAIASDAAKGGQVFLQRLVGFLKENGVIAQHSSPNSLEQILQSIALMGQQGASAIDMPPLSMAEIKVLANDLRQSTAALARDSNNLLPDFETIWNQISQIARKEHLSVEQVMAMLSISAASVSKTGLGTADAVGKTGAVILDEMILNDYKETLDAINAVGALPYMQTHMRPFVENAQSHFDFSRETGSQKCFKRLFMKLTGKLPVTK